jgi:hypothetical protein
MPSSPRLGDLPLARRDLERLHQILGLQRRLQDLAGSARAQRALTHRSVFREALTWLEIHGQAPDIVEHWTKLVADGRSEEGAEAAETERPRFRRRRRRRRFRPQP